MKALIACTLFTMCLLNLKPVMANAEAENRIRQDTDYLASDELAGRLTGTEGSFKAADYIRQKLQTMGAQPVEGFDDYYQPFDFSAGASDAGSSLNHQDKLWQGEPALRALSFSSSGTIEGELVFAGYGLTLPDSADFGYDSYVGLDVRDKIVVVLRYTPEEADPEVRKQLNRYSGLRYKAMRARENGALGMLVVTGPRSPNAGKLVSMSFDSAMSGSGIVAASISIDLAEQLFAASGKTLEDAQASLDTANPHVGGFELGTSAIIDLKLKREKKSDRNVLGVLKSETPRADQPWVLIGAHYDHLGDGSGGNSMARKGEVGQVHNGADDNASGVAAVLEAGRILSGHKLDHHVLLAFWAGEEMGLIGSSEFASQTIIPMNGIGAAFNLDMVGRSIDNKLSLQAVGSADGWRSIIEQANILPGFNLNLSDDPYLPTDASTFYQAEVPVLSVFTGSHEDYHRPTDDTDKLNIEGIARVSSLTANLVRRVSSRSTPLVWQKVERNRTDTGDRASLRAYTGTIPDYTTETDGLRLSGVSAGGPADLAGLQSGDVIIQLGSSSITNIYDYTYALDLVRIDEPVLVRFRRDGVIHEVSMTPTSRD